MLVLTSITLADNSFTLVDRSGSSNTYYDEVTNKYAIKIYSEPINYFDGSKYQPLDLTIRNLGDFYGVETGFYKIYFSNKVRIEYEGHTMYQIPVSLRLANQDFDKTISTLEIENNKAVYKNIFGDGIDLQYKYLKGRLKEDLIINNLQILKSKNPQKIDNLELTFKIIAFSQENNRLMPLRIDETKIMFNDEIDETVAQDYIRFLDDNNELFSFTQPYVYDSKYDILKLNYFYSVDNKGNLFIKTKVPYNWLEKATYPVYIDPTLELDITTGVWGKVESHCDNDWEFENHDLQDIGNIDSSTDRTHRGWTGFDVSSIDDSATISDVDLNYYVEDVDDDTCPSVDLQFYKLDEEYYDTQPNNDGDMEDIYEAIGDDTEYAGGSFENGDTGWYSEDLGSVADTELQSLIDANPTNIFLIGIKTEEDDDHHCTGEDCRMDIADGNNLPYLSVEYIIPCIQNSDCEADEYCDDTQTCVSQLGDGQTCDGITYEGTQTSEDEACSSNYCDSDGVGLADDNHCFNPYNIYFDDQENSYCEYSTNLGTSEADERSVGTDLNTCNQAGYNYYEDEVSSTCGITDDTSVFECDETGCLCSEDLCDGLTQGDDISTCANEETWFLDQCTSTASGEDRNDICSSSGDCTGDVECDGIQAGTGDCDSECNYVSPVIGPENIIMYVDNNQVWEYNGEFLTTETIDFTNELNTVLQTCTEDVEGYCTIPITIHSDTAGNITANNININFDIAEYIWDTIGLAELSTYRVAVTASDGLLTSWDESDADFTIGNVINLLQDGQPCTLGSECQSNYCDNDGVGLVDDNWCFTPENLYFDNQEPTFCEYSTGNGNLHADEREVWDNLNTCDESGYSYYEDEVTLICAISDDTSVFECDEAGCSCNEPLCDGLTQGDDIQTCSVDEDYFADQCTSTASGEDRDDICRSSDYDVSCTADTQCNGIQVGTGECDSSCNYVQPLLADMQPCTLDSECQSGYCDNDGVGWEDDNWCFTPYNTYFDEDDFIFPGIYACEYSTGFGDVFADELFPNIPFQACNYSSELYYEDIISNSCEVIDITTQFECNELGCYCSEPLCDGHIMGDDIQTCSAEETYFADQCTSDADGENRDNICRSSYFDASCTGDVECNGVQAGTGDCDLNCNYQEPINNSCVDSDNGQDIYTPGFVQGNWYAEGNNNIHNDYCYGLEYIYEMSCNQNDQGIMEKLPCGAGYECHENLCELSGDTYVQCVDSDGGLDYYTAGYAEGTYLFGIYYPYIEDYCTGSGKLGEFYCKNDGVRDYVYVSYVSPPNGYVCDGGMFIVEN